MNRTFLVEAFRIPAGSMENTRQVGDFLFLGNAIIGSRATFTRPRLPASDSPRRGAVVFIAKRKSEPTVPRFRLTGIRGQHGGAAVH